MSGPPYMRIYWGDYFRDTRHLNRLEHSAYLLLLGEMFSRGGKLPADDEILATLTLCTAKEWAAVRPRVMAFFRVSKGKITQKRVTAELAQYRDTVLKRKLAGKKGSSVTNEKRKGNRAANAEQKPTKPEPEPERSLEGSKKPSKSSRRVTDDERAGGSSPPRSEVIHLEAVRDEKAEAERAAERESIRAGMLEVAASLGRKANP
jgi:uncharacterized protein YdaU (DUF1376 family)